jgi:hypothetical protein
LPRNAIFRFVALLCYGEIPFHLLLLDSPSNWKISTAPRPEALPMAIID